MELHKIIEATQRPAVYSKGTASMWVDEYISDRLLEAHLNPDIELASRKETTSHADLEDLLALHKFRTTKCYDRLIPGCDMYRSEDVTFCIATK